MSADDTQASEWERRGAEVMVEHRPVPMLEGFRIASWTCQACYRNFGEYPDFAAHVMAAFREAGLAAVERERTFIRPAGMQHAASASLVEHERFSTTWREVTA